MTPLSPEPTVDVLVSGLNEEQYVERCLRAVLAQEYPLDLLGVIYVDGGSADGTVEVARRLASEDPRLTVVALPGRVSLPAALNIGLSLTGAAVVAKVDCHGWPEPDFVRRAVDELLDDPTLAAVGGRPLQQGETPWGRAAARARTSRFGTGGSVYAGRAARAYVDTVQCGVYRRDALQEVGGFDDRMQFGEDEEVNWRIRNAGHRILVDSAVRFHYVTRSSWAGLTRQYRDYGRAKARVVRRHPRLLRPWHLAPPMAAMSVATCALLAPRVRLARALVVIGSVGYAGTAAAAARGASEASSASDVARTAAAYVGIHGGYAWGWMLGAVDLVRSGRRG